MLTLYHHPFCPFSRFVRLALSEHGLAPRFIEERPWERRTEFLTLNPAGTTPVLIEEGRPPVPDATIIAEFLDETVGPDLGERRLMPTDINGRIEVRRLMAWFNQKFAQEVSGPLVEERIYSRHMASAQGGSPDMNVIRAALTNIRYHLAYIGWLVRTRDWLAGTRMTYADLAAAAHLSSIDYLGDVPWAEDDAAKIWYSRVKSRPSFRPLLAEIQAGLPPSRTYADLDF
jgi:glutathione S-transferase